MFILIAVLLGACASPVVTPATSSTVEDEEASPTALTDGPVLVGDEDSEVFTGTLYGNGSVAVILASRQGSPGSSWSSEAVELAAQGYTVLTVGSDADEEQTLIYVENSVLYFRSHGFERIVCVGAGNGADACAYSSAAPQIKGIVLLSYKGGADLSTLRIPKLFMAAELDTAGKTSTLDGLAGAAEPKQLALVSGATAPGPEMLDTPGRNWRQLVYDFIGSCAAA